MATMDDVRTTTLHRWGPTIAGGPVAGVIGYFFGKVLDVWGILDGPAAALGGFLKGHVTGTDLAAAIGFIVFALLYALILRWAWAGHRLSRLPALDETASAPQLKPAAPVVEERSAGTAHPNFKLDDLVTRIIATKGPFPEDEAGRREFVRSINLEIADGAWMNGLTVWGRYMEQPLKILAPRSLQHARWNVVDGTVSLPSDWKEMKFTDVRFVRDEIDKIWPEAKAADEGPVISPKPSAPEEKKALSEIERGPCKAALIEIHEFLTNDFAAFHRDLVEAQSSTNLDGLIRNISPFRTRAEHAEIALKGLGERHAIACLRMGDLDLQPLVEAIRELKNKLARVREGVSLSWPHSALMERVGPMHKKNLEVGNLAKSLIKQTEEKNIEFFSE